jgi:hypothetical protein
LEDLEMLWDTNSIEPATDAAGSVRKDLSRGDGMPIREATRAEEKRRRPTAADADTDAVAKRHNLYTANQRFPSAARIYYSDYQQKSEVMRAKLRQITTKLDDRQTVSAMLDLVQSRNWQAIRLRGSDSFRREAWVQAQVRGLQTEGYKPAATDLQELGRRQIAVAPVATAKGAAAPVTAAKDAAAPHRAKSRKATDTTQHQRAQEKAVWNVVETRGKAARQQDAARPAENAAEKPPAPAEAA